MKTIVAISTPIGSGGISIVRMSGDNSLNIAFSLFKNKKLTKNNIQPRYMYLGDFVTSDFSDKCLMVYFKAPYSYTGEDLIEFHCHGGEYLTEKVLDSCLNKGAILAENGEFTKRAFLNGKISLDSVEGVADLINATSDAEIRAGFNLINGKLYKEIKNLQSSLTTLMAELDVSLDYPEHNVEFTTLKKTNEQLDIVYDKIKQLYKTEKQGKLIKNGINVCIVGKPNAGKSSILNSLIGEERAIVTDIAGTTRDVLKESIVHKGIKINFLDTAGIRSSKNTVEKIGIEKAKTTLSMADIVLFVVDTTTPLEKQDEDILLMLKNKNTITLLNKSDLSFANNNYPNGIEVSAVTGKNIDKVKDKILEIVKLKNLNNTANIITNSRQSEALKQALLATENAKNAIKTNMVDIVASEVMQIWQCLGKVTGETETDSIIDEIFSKFCLGK